MGKLEGTKMGDKAQRTKPQKLEERRDKSVFARVYTRILVVLHVTMPKHKPFMCPSFA